MACIDEKYLHEFFDGRQKGLCILSRDLVINDCNRYFITISGCEGKIRGRDIYSILPAVPPDFFDNNFSKSSRNVGKSFVFSDHQGEYLFECIAVDEKDGRIICLLEKARPEDGSKNLFPGMNRAIELSPVSIIFTDNNGNIVYVNPGFETMTGYSAGEVIGENFSVLKYSETDEKFYGEVIQTLNRGDVWKGELSVRRKNGDILFESATVSPTFDQDGNVVNYMKIAENITEYKKMMEMLVNSYDFIENVMNSISPLFVVDGDGTFIMVNRSFVEQTGYPIASVVSKHVSEIFNAVMEKQIYDLLESPVPDEQSVFETSFEIESGEYRIINVRISSISVAEGGRHVVGSFEDISGRKLAEDERDKLSRAIEQSPSSVIITSIDGDIEYVNPKFSQLTGYTIDEVRGENPRILKSGKQDSEFYRDLWETILQGREWRGEFHNRKKNGDLYWEFASISPYRNRKGEVTHFIAVKEDITERKNAEEALRISEENLRKKNTAMLKELQYAQIAIKNMLPPGGLQWSGIKGDFRYIPLEAIGGDYFNFYNLEENKKGIFIGDLAGHGVSAALYLSLVKSTVERLIPEYGTMPSKMLNILNDELYSAMSAYFLTALYGCIEVKDEKIIFRFARAGHCPPIIVDCRRGTTDMIMPKGKPIGMFPDNDIEERAIQFNRGERIYLFTDGLHETVNEKRQMLDFEGLRKIIRKTTHVSLEESLDIVISEVRNFRGRAPAEDDIVLLGLDFPEKMI